VTGRGADGAGGTVTAWFHCFSGIAGDMALGSLLAAGADEREVRALLERVPLGGWELRVELALRGGIACTRAIVTGHHDRVVRTHAHIAALIHEARLPERVTARALAVFAALAEAEGLVHRRPPEQVHFHEVGGHDAVVDVVGTVAALEVLGVDEVCSSPVALGTGMIRAEHGLLPNPAPAVVHLLVGVPTYGRETNAELTTPTGAALLQGLGGAFGPMPAMTVTATGFGAGTRDAADMPNCTQVVLGIAAPADTGTGGGGQPVVALETNIDDVTGEQLAGAIAALLEAGAHDAWITPVLMKKGRPGFTVHALADPATVESLRDVLRRTTGSFGVRATRGERWPSPRTLDEVRVDGESVRMKVGPDRAKAEWDDVARVATRTGRSASEVSSLAEEAWRRRTRRGGPDPDEPEPA
jgi:hypothetical protein